MRSYHGFIHQSSLIGGSGVSRNRAFSRPLATISSERFISTYSFHGSGDVVIDWLLQYTVSRAYELHNFADVLVSLNHLIALLNSFTLSQW